MRGGVVCAAMAAPCATLAIDTSLRACAVAVTGGAWASEPMQRGQAQRLIPMVGEVLARAGLSYADVRRVAVAVGPGSFTGVRVGISAALGLGLALGVPVVGVSTLAALGIAEPPGPELHEAIVHATLPPADPRAVLALADDPAARRPVAPVYLRPPGVTRQN
jgi:tRNA threonylcarbamoyl adenosine modification protein YeaZ